MKKKIKIFLILISIILFTIIICLVIVNKRSKVYYAKDFNIDIIKSEIDFDNDGIDDYMDIMLGARIDAINKPKYDSSYYSGGYPPDNVGVCSDVIWRAFKNAGYMLKDMIDQDIKNNIDEYPSVVKRDSNIDFRRVRNLKIFFDKYAVSLTNDINHIEEWMPGDIVIFGKKYTHIGIISDKRNKKGIPYLIHNAGQSNREEDSLKYWDFKYSIIGHYRWNGGVL